MTKILIAALAASTLIIPSMAVAQALPAPIIAVVDVQRATSQCNACKTALSQLETQVTSIRALQTQLETPLRTEAASIQAAATALGGRAPDAALTARATAFERKQGDAQRQLAARQQTFERNREHVLNQIRTRLNPVLTQVQTRRNATIMLDAANVVRVAPSVDVTADVIAGLNTSLPSISTTAPAQAAPAGR